MASNLITVDSVANHIVDNYESKAVEFFNKKSPKLIGAKYSTGSFGRMVAPLVKSYYPNLNLNGSSTSIALAIQDRLEKKGYKFIWGQKEQTRFAKN